MIYDSIFDFNSPILNLTFYADNFLLENNLSTNLLFYYDNH